MPDFEMFAGDTPTLGFTVADANGDPMDLNGATIRWQAARSVNSRPPLIEKSIGSGISVTNAALGQFDVALAATDTENLRGALYHEAEIIDDQGNVITVIAGTMTVTPTLIKPET